MVVDRYGLCIVADKYFIDFPHIHHENNKNQSRPHYLAIKQANNIFWLIPLNSHPETYAPKIAEGEKRYGHGNHIFHYIAKVRGTDRVFLIGKAIPVTEPYIVKPFTICGKPFIIEDEKDRKEIQSRLSRYLSMLRTGRLKSEVDVLSIENKLLNQMNNSDYLL
ncbi:MAG: hypothetical protein RSA62_05950 [Oscillospiraceae bacterium]